MCSLQRIKASGLLGEDSNVGHKGLKLHWLTGEPTCMRLDEILISRGFSVKMGPKNSSLPCHFLSRFQNGNLFPA